MAADPSLTDVELQDEIDLVGTLVLAAAETDGPLTQEAIDELLGLGGGSPSGTAPAPAER